MPTRCVAIGCINTADVNRKSEAQIELEKVTKITFHSFPSDPVRRMQWIKIMNLEDRGINKRSRLCSLHFKEEFMDRTSLVYIFDETLCDEMEDEISIKNEVKWPLKSLFPTMNFLNLKMNAEDGKETSIMCSTCDKATNTSPSSSLRRSTEDKETRISPERIWNMNNPTVEAIRKAARVEIEILRKKMKVMRQKLLRKEKKIAIMKTTLNKLKIENLIND
nr:PREDICTED: THAP domain-containing protein 2-like isoform X2 [Linepithema humile]